MKKKKLIDPYIIPSQIDVGTPEQRNYDAIETPVPLAKGSDGMPRFNELEDAQKKNMPKAMRSQVAFQQKKLQWSHYQILNFQIKPSDDGTTTQAYYNVDYNQAVAVGTAMTDGVMFGSGIKNSDSAKYYNIVYANVRFGQPINSDFFINPPSYVEFYPMQKVPGGVFGGKIPRQIEAVRDKTNLDTLSIGGTEFGVQSFGIDVYNENAYYTQSPDLKGIRCIGIALKCIQLNFDAAIALDDIKLDIEIGYDLNTEGNNY